MRVNKIYIIAITITKTEKVKHNKKLKTVEKYEA